MSPVLAAGVPLAVPCCCGVRVVAEPALLAFWTLFAVPEAPRAAPGVAGLLRLGADLRPAGFGTALAALALATLGLEALAGLAVAICRCSACCWCASGGATAVGLSPLRKHAMAS